MARLTQQGLANVQQEIDSRGYYLLKSFDRGLTSKELKLMWYIDAINSPAKADNGGWYYLNDVPGDFRCNIVFVAYVHVLEPIQRTWKIDNIADLTRQLDLYKRLSELMEMDGHVIRGMKHHREVELKLTILQEYGIENLEDNEEALADYRSALVDIRETVEEEANEMNRMFVEQMIQQAKEGAMQGGIRGDTVRFTHKMFLELCNFKVLTLPSAAPNEQDRHRYTIPDYVTIDAVDFKEAYAKFKDYLNTVRRRDCRLVDKQGKLYRANSIEIALLIRLDLIPSTYIETFNHETTTRGPFSNSTESDPFWYDTGLIKTEHIDLTLRRLIGRESHMALDYHRPFEEPKLDGGCDQDDRIEDTNNESTGDGPTTTVS